MRPPCPAAVWRHGRPSLSRCPCRAPREWTGATIWKRCSSSHLTTAVRGGRSLPLDCVWLALALRRVRHRLVAERQHLAALLPVHDADERDWVGALLLRREHDLHVRTRQGLQDGHVLARVAQLFVVRIEQRHPSEREGPGVSQHALADPPAEPDHLL